MALTPVCVPFEGRETALPVAHVKHHLNGTTHEPRKGYAGENDRRVHSHGPLLSSALR